MVSDSFGHDIEADNSKSSEEKTSATGSKVAPRSKGSLFSPMEKAKKAQKDVYPFMSRELNNGDITICAVHLGVRSIVCVFVEQTGRRGWEIRYKKKIKKAQRRVLSKILV